jgi:hypothetical protein
VLDRPPGDFLLFVHLIDAANGTIVAQRDTHPGLGNFPSSQWQPGDRFVERLSIYLPETAYAPTETEVRAGLYAPEGYRLGVSDGATGQGLGDSFALGNVAIAPGDAADNLPNAGNYLFEDRFRLAGYQYNQRILGPYDELAVTLYWEPLHDFLPAYDVQVRLLNEAGDIVHAQEVALDPMPAGEITPAGYTIPPDPNRPPGAYTVQLSLEDPATDRRLQLVAPDGRWLADELRLSAVRIGE